MSFFTKEEDQLRLTGFLTLPFTMVLKGDKSHASTHEQSVDRLRILVTYISLSENIPSKSYTF